MEQEEFIDHKEEERVVEENECYLFVVTTKISMKWGRDNFLTGSPKFYTTKAGVKYSIATFKSIFPLGVMGKKYD